MGWLGSRGGPRRTSLARKAQYCALAAKGLRHEPGFEARPVRGCWRVVRASQPIKKSDNKTPGVFFHAAFDYQAPGLFELRKFVLRLLYNSKLSIRYFDCRDYDFISLYKLTFSLKFHYLS